MTPMVVKVRPRRRTPKAPMRRRQLRVERLEDRFVLSQTSAPVILQYFEATDQTIEQRAPDLFNAGYGQFYLPPPGRADTGNTSVGYDIYNRFDLGGPNNPTLYGTQSGLQALVQAVHQFGGNVYADLLWNSGGFRDQSSVDRQGHSFINAGGYPGFLITASFDYNGDYHPANATGDWETRVAGLIDIAQEKDYQYIRSPVNPNDSRNLPAGTIPAYGEIANVPDPNNAQYYPDHSLQPIIVYDPTTGEQNIHVYPFNNANPLGGTPTPENDLGYLMRYAQWMIQVIGVDGFRVDAAKNMPPWVLNYLDRADYRQSFRYLLNGHQENPFSFSEVFDGSHSLLQQYVRKDINPNDPGRIGGNRDVLDFPLYFAMNSNLTGNGLQNSWYNVANAGMSNDGSEGVSFVSNQDVTLPYLSNVAYAYTLTRPGNAVVYFNGHQFGDSHARPFPKDGRGDALGGLYGTTLTTLVNIRDEYPEGNYIQRDLEKEILAYERQDSLLVGLSNRLDRGYDSRTVHTSFPAGTPLIELTGNAADPTIDPDHVIPELVVVNSDGTVNFRVPRNRNDNNVETDKGYVIYGPSGPQGHLSLTNIDHVIPGETPTPQTNGTARLSSLPVIIAGSFQIELDTNQVNLLGSYRDHDADGDNALFKIDGGVDVTGHGFVSTDPNSVAYGFQQFNDVHSPGYFNGNGNGRYVQTINTSGLSDGVHYITVRAFRHRNASEPPVFTDFRQAIYIDHSRPNSQIVSLVPIVPGVNENQQLTVQSDATINNVHVLWDLPGGLTDAQVLSMVNNSNQAHQSDRYLWTYNLYGLTSGNHVATVVSYELSGNYNIQRFPGLSTSTIFGAGLGDLNFDGQIDANDVNLFAQVLNSNNSQLNPAADFNGDGSIDNSDLLLYYPVLQNVGDPNALAAYNQLLGPPLAGLSINVGDTLNLTTNQPGTTSPPLAFTWDINAAGTFDVSGANATLTWDQLAGYGITGPGVYQIISQVTDGTNVDDFYTTLTVQGTPAPALRGGLGAVPVFAQVLSPTPAILSGVLGAAPAGGDASSALGLNPAWVHGLAPAKPQAAEPVFRPVASLSRAIPSDPLSTSLVSPVLLADHQPTQEIPA